MFLDKEMHEIDKFGYKGSQNVIKCTQITFTESIIKTPIVH